MAFYDCVRTLNINTLDELKPYISIYHVLAPSETQCNHLGRANVFFSNVLIVACNSSLERSHPKDSKTGFIFVVGQILKILHHF